MENQKSALGLDGNVTALIGYLIPLVALIMIFIEKDNKFVRYHAIQAVLWVVLCVVGIFAIAIFGFIFVMVISMASSTLGSLVGLLFFLLYIVLFFVYIGGLIFGAIKGFGGGMFKFPVIGNMAEKWSS